MLFHSPGTSHLFSSFEGWSKAFSEFLIKKNQTNLFYVCVYICLSLGIYPKQSLTPHKFSWLGYQKDFEGYWEDYLAYFEIKPFNWRNACFLWDPL